MPLVYDWLKHAEATRRLVKENYSHYEGEELIEITVAENVLTQLENLQTYPIIRSKLRNGKLSLHGWIYRIEAGEVLAYDGILHDFVPPQSRLPSPEPEYNLHPSCPLFHQVPFTVSGGENLAQFPAREVNDSHTSNGNGAKTSHLPGYGHLPSEQADRIYRGSH
jgi:carbonic anhydrase